MELWNRVEQRGSAEVAENVRGALVAIDRSKEFIKLALAVLMTPARSAAPSPTALSYNRSYGLKK